MHLVTESLQSRDRWILGITKLDPQTTRRFEPHGTAYVMLRNASFESDGMKLTNKTAVLTATEPFFVSTHDGFAAVVDYHGLRALETQVMLVDPRRRGNLSYMDGGTNTTAISPGRNGEPVINYVHFPPGMDQTPHVHPSHRIGFCLSGRGRTDLKEHTVHLSEGDLFFMERMELHHFVTEDEDCVLFVFSPDSETGPTDEYNPLKSRTYIAPK
jgi:quercetin dioxygenase-like cupin family protein